MHSQEQADPSVGETRQQPQLPQRSGRFERLPRQLLACLQQLLLAAWRGTLGGAFWVLSRDEAVAIGLYGPVVADHVRPFVGDVVAVARADSAVADSRVMPRAVLDLVGLHGSVTEDELVVPLLVHRT